MPYANPNALVSTEWLAAHHDAPDVRVVDATFTLQHTGRQLYDQGHLPGAVHFDIDDIADDTNPLPHMLPSPEKFSSRVRKLGLGDGSRIVIYNKGLSAATRAWWMFRLFGHSDVAVLDGGFAKWEAEGRPTTTDVPTPRERHFTARMNTMLVRDLDQVRANLPKGGEQVVDVRAAGRFAGTAPEPRPGLRSGHMPGAINLPYESLLDAKTQTLLPADALRQRILGAGIDLARPVIASCGSGVTACWLGFALHMLGHRDWAIYDGSWTEWGGRQDTPVVT
ncbi:MAG: 3-mercaptopyruvate sulfurtransferase [Alphaproteobacteria bacterium]|nr:3-mercaptopyruvate sulfurtransferase [Alphaproteobacteria bacterium]